MLSLSFGVCKMKFHHWCPPWKILLGHPWKNSPLFPWKKSFRRPSSDWLHIFTVRNWKQNATYIYW